MRDRSDLRGKTLRRRVNERIDGALADPEARHRDEKGKPQGRQGVALRIAVTRGGDPAERQGGADDIARKMQRVGGERVASRRRGDPLQRTPTHQIDDDRGNQNPENERIGLDYCVVACKPLDRLDQYIDGEREQESGFDQSHQGLDLGMAELMLLVGGLIRDPYREIGEGGGCHIGEIMAGLGEDRERARGKPGGEFCRRHQRAHRDRGKRRSLLQPAGPVHRRFPFRGHGSPAHRKFNSSTCEEAARHGHASMLYTMANEWLAFGSTAPGWDHQV